MPDFEVSGPDGARYQITAPDEAAALAAFSQLQGGAVNSRETKVPSSRSLTNLARSAAHGVPLLGGVSDAIEAGLESAIAPAVEPFLTPGPNTLTTANDPKADFVANIGNRYTKARELQRQKTAAFETEHPVADTVAKLAGGVASLGGVAARVPGAAKALGFEGTLPQMIGRGAVSGAALSGADAAIRGHDVADEAGVGAVLGAAGGPAGRVIGKVAAKIMPRGEVPAPVPRETVNVGGVEVPIPPQDVNAAGQIEMARKGSSGDAAKAVVEGSDAATKAAVDRATETIAAEISGGPAAAARGTADDAANLVRSHAQDAELTRFQTEQATGGRAAAEAARLRGDLAPDPYTGQPMVVADSPYTAAETVGGGVAQRREAAQRGVRQNYEAANAVPGEFDPAVPRTMAEEIRTRLNRGDDPLWVDPQSTGKANEALKILDQSLGTGLFRNAAAARPVAGPPGPAGGAPAAPVARAAPSDAEIAFNELVAKGASPERARAAVAKLPGSESVTARGALDPHTVAVADGSSIEVRPKIVEAGSVRTSADSGYDPALQPRDRKRAQSDMQINDIAKNLAPQRLGASAEADRGAPIIGADGVVESGNARTLAVRQAYKENGPAALRYRAYLASEGADISGFREPMLVRERATPMSPAERKAFTVAANQSSTLSLSAPERALADSRALTPDTLALIRNPGDLGAVENRDFVRQFMGTLPQAERGALTTKAGDLSSEGLARVRNAVLAKAYGDTPILARVAESTRDEVKSISNGLMAAAPEWAQLRAAVSRGEVPKGLDVTADLLDAVERTARIRGKGTSLAEGVAQRDAFAQQSPESEAFMRLFYDADGAKAAPASQIGNGVRSYAQEALKVDAAPGLDLGLAPVTSKDILASVTAKAGAPKALAAEVQAAAKAPPEVPAAAAGVPVEDALPPIGVREMDAARKRLNVLRGEANRKSVMTGEGSDLRAINRIIGEFDAIEREAHAAGRFSGDSDAAQALRERARQSHGEMRQTFSSRGGSDPVGRKVEKILGRYADTAATPDQIATMSYGSAAEPGGGDATQVAQRLRQILGPTSPEWGAWKQGLFEHVRGTGSPAEQAARIDKFLTGNKGRILAETTLSADERAALRTHAENLRRAEPQALGDLKGVDRVMAKISGRLDGIPSSNKEIIAHLYGGAKDAGGKSLSVALAQRLEREMTPEAFGKIREGLLRHVMERPEGVPEWSAAMIAKNIHMMRNSSLGLALYTPKQLKGIGELANAIKAQVPPAGAVNTSNSATIGGKMLKSTMGLFLPAIGAASHGPMGIIAGMAANKGAASIQNARAARQVKSLLYHPQRAAIDPRFARAGAILSRGAAQGQIEGGR